MRVVILLAALLCAACQSGAQPALRAADAGQPIVLGQGYDIVSAALGEVQRVNVYLPPGYAKGETRYPVLYLIDGGVDQDFVHIAGLSQHATISGSFREMIVVGVETKDRRRELTFPAVTDTTLRRDYPTHGESGKFRAFLANEVKPWVEQRYRTDGFDAVMGESLAGLFVTETFLKQPDLFDGYAAIDPSLWWDKEALSREAPGLLAKQAGGTHTLLMAIADSGVEMRVGQAQMAAAIKAATLPGVTFVYEPMLDEQHSTIYHRAALNALRLLFRNPPEAKP
jgi:predicted alpha/beta superfamily hydrolase